MTTQCESTDKFKQFLVRLWEQDLHDSEDGNTLIRLKKTQLQMPENSANHLSQKILQGLDAAVKAMAVLVPEGKQISPFAESEVALLCADLGLQLEAGSSVREKFLARRQTLPANDETVPAKKCPAFDPENWTQNRCTGNACGLECLPILL